MKQERAISIEQTSTVSVVSNAKKATASPVTLLLFFSGLVFGVLPSLLLGLQWRELASGLPYLVSVPDLEQFRTYVPKFASLSTIATTAVLAFGYLVLIRRKSKVVTKNDLRFKPKRSLDTKPADLISEDVDHVEVVVPGHLLKDDDEIPAVRVIPDGASFILSPDQMHQIALKVLPPGIAEFQWKRLYSLARHGDSWALCLNRIQRHSRTLIVLRTGKNAILGGFADAVWNPHPSFFGGTSSCLFRIDDEGVVHAYKWSGLNRYILRCELMKHRLAFGGGGDGLVFGLSMEKDFLLGTTGRSQTFLNDPLCDESIFQIIDVDIIGFVLE